MITHPKNIRKKTPERSSGLKITKKKKLSLQIIIHFFII